MGKMSLPAMPTPKHTSYDNFRGADFSVDPSLVAKNRSPMPLNMIPDNGGNPVKRPGWRVLATLDAPINGIYKGEIAGLSSFIVHAGTKLYKVNEYVNPVTFTEVATGLTNAKSTGFFSAIDSIVKLFIFTGGEYICFDGATSTDVTTFAKIPTTIISRAPTGGGVALEGLNLIQPKHTESFLGTANTTAYQLATSGLDAALVTARVRNASGGWDDKVETTHFTVNRTTGLVTWVTAPGAPLIVGQDNVEITPSKTITGYADKIKKCTIFSRYGLGGATRIFASGNPDRKSYDWYSGVNDPTYFADLNYSIAGSEDTAIMGYCSIGEYQGIIKEENQQEATIYLRYGELDTSGKTVFKLKQGIAGVGAISKKCFVNLKDDPLFLSRTGVYGITGTTIVNERTVENRSFFVDKKLTAESNLENAIACEWNGYCVINVNGRCYLLDSRHKAAISQVSTQFVYESYYWENVPAVCMLSNGGELFFGTSDGKLCKFNTDIAGELAYNDNGTAIVCQWATPNDNDNATQIFKTMLKKGCLVTLSPYNRSSGKVYFVKDGDPETFVIGQNMDIFDWETFDFERPTFNSSNNPQEIFFNKKSKKYKRMQIIVRNEALNEPFGIHEIVKTYTYGNYSKARG